MAGWDRGAKSPCQSRGRWRALDVVTSWPFQPLPLPLSSQALHPNWCQQVKFIPQLNMVASCSAIEKSSLVLTLLPSKDLESPK